MKKNKFIQFLLSLAKASLCLVFSMVALAVLLLVVRKLAVSAPVLQEEPTEHTEATYCDVSIMDAFDEHFASVWDEAHADTLAVRKHFWIDPEAELPPLPNQACFGSAASPAELQWLLDKAAPLLDGQETTFHTGIEILEGSEVQYYLDETILVITWKQVMDDFVYTISEIKIQDPSQFRRYLVDRGSMAMRFFYTTEMSQQNNAVVAFNGDFYTNRPIGIVVYDGEIVRTVKTSMLDTCYIDSKGDMIFTKRNTHPDKESVETFVAENDVVFSLAFGPILIDNGELVEIDGYPLGEIKDKYPRSALCQKDDLHYLLVAANPEGRYRKFITIATFAKNIYTLGCDKAYTLDGGQTVTLVMNHEVINDYNYPHPRRTRDIIYFATALPNYSTTEE